MTGERPLPNMDAILEGVFRKMGLRPEHIIVPNLLIRKGEEMELYVCPQKLGELYGSKEAARRQLEPGQTLYDVRIRRIE